jgi:IPT/TIG domain
MIRARGLLLGGACFVTLAGLTVAASAAAARPGSTLEHASAFAFVRAPGSFGGGTSTLGSKVPLVPTQTVTGVSPNAGASGPGGEQAVTITGSGFTGATDVFFGTTDVPSAASYPCLSSPAGCFTVVNDTTIDADTPAGMAGTVDVTVDSGTVNPPQDQYSFFDPPTVTSVPSASQHQGATGIAVAGTNFSYAGVTPLTSGVSEVDLVPTGAGSTVHLTAACSTGTPPDCFAFVDDTHLTIDLPTSMPAGQYDTEVVTPGGTSATSASDLLDVLPSVPTLTSLTPSSGSTLGGNNVVVAGTNFTGATDVNFGLSDLQPCPSTPCFTFDSDTQITVHSVPAHAAGSVNVTVTTPSGTSGSQSYTYVLPPPPTLTSLSPTSGSTNGGNSVILTGTNFTGATDVKVGSSDLGPCPSAPCFTFDNDTQITVTMPANTPGTVNVSVKTPEGTTGNLSYAYAVVPAVATVSPKFGATSGGAFVTVLGSDFGSPALGFGATDVVFGTKDVPATRTFPCPGSPDGCFSQIGTTTLDVYTPAVAAGTVDITVITPGGSSTASPPADRYTFIAPGAYTAINPFRICDTRPSGHGITLNECDATGPGTLVPGRETITVQITGTGHVPSGARAVVANISAIDHGSGATFVTAYPTDGSRPLASNINLSGGRVGSNLAIVQLSVGGAITLFNSVGSADVIVDVEGYFAAPGGNSAGTFHSIPPLRICDSRALTGNTTLCARATGSTSAPLIGGTWRPVVLSGVPPGTSLSVPHIPTDGTAAAAVFNLTGTAGSAPTYLSVAVPNATTDACPNGQPSFSNLNPTPGISLPNRVISNLGPHQDICLYSAAGTINFVIDVNGWFGTAAAPPGALFYSVPPTRICDTRPTFGTRCEAKALSTNFTEPIYVAGIVAVPAWNAHAPPPVAVVANLTGIAGSAATYFTLYPSDASPKPTASDLNPSAGEVIGDLAITSLAQTGANEGNVNLYNAVGSINAILDVAGWFE